MGGGNTHVLSEGVKGTIAAYRGFTGYSRKTVDEKLLKIFGATGKRPSVEDFTKSVIAGLSESAAGRNPDLEEGQLDRNQMAARKDAAHAEKLEMENSVRRGDLVEADEVKRSWVQICSNIRASLMSLPSRMAKELSAMEEPRAIQMLLDQEVRATLESLAE